MHRNCRARSVQNSGNLSMKVLRTRRQVVEVTISLAPTQCPKPRDVTKPGYAEWPSGYSNRWWGLWQGTRRALNQRQKRKIARL